MSRFAVTHTTTYRYQSTVSSSYGQACLLPRSSPEQSVISAALTVQPQPAHMTTRVDAFGNLVSYIEVREPHQLLEVTATSEVDIVRPQIQFLPAVQESLAEARRKLVELEAVERVEAARFLTASSRVPLDDQVRNYALASIVEDRPVFDFIRNLTERINSDFTFDSSATTVTSTIADLFERGGGVCQDFAHLAVGCLRSAGLPARYVSGYLETFPPAGQPKLIGADVSHAWAAVLIPGAGWVNCDPTNNQFADDRYVTTAWGRDYDDVTPVKGVIYSNGGMTQLSVSVDVHRIVPDQQQPQ
ncbi:MAG: transglutaminase family protein [Acidimicrobiales bacterium]|nr:transglutaminase family protein [Acidimicrobiales bacterium]